MAFNQQQTCSANSDASSYGVQGYSHPWNSLASGKLSRANIRQLPIADRNGFLLEGQFRPISRLWAVNQSVRPIMCSQHTDSVGAHSTPAHKQRIQFVHAHLKPGGAAVVALAGAFGGFHFAQ